MQEYHKYSYDGPVMEFNTLIDNRWEGETIAPNENKAKSNLAYQYKKQHNKLPSAKISFPGKVIIIK